jgi:hypothetical protein
MDAKKLLAAIAVVFVILVASGYLVHQAWLGATYNQMRENDFSFRSPEAIQHRMWILLAGDLCYAAFFVWIYTRGVEAKPWIGQGIRYAVVMSLFTVVPPALSDYVAYFLPYTLAIKWMVAGFVTLLVMGLAVAAICKKPPATS